ncbi:hypothetical protein ACNGLJ_00015 [Campylobacter coli]
MKNPKNAKNIIKKKSKYATKQEVIEVLKNKYNLKTSKELGLGRSKNVFWVKDNKQIKEIWEEITDGADILKDINQDKLGGTIKMRKLDDQTIIQYKKASKSGGETIEVNSNKPRGNLRTIHIENGVKNEV